MAGVVGGRRTVPSAVSRVALRRRRPRAVLRACPRVPEEAQSGLALWAREAYCRVERGAVGRRRRPVLAVLLEVGVRPPRRHGGGPHGTVQGRSAVLAWLRASRVVCFAKLLKKPVTTKCSPACGWERSRPQRFRWASCASLNCVQRREIWASARGGAADRQLWIGLRLPWCHLLDEYGDHVRVGGACDKPAQSSQDEGPGANGIRCHEERPLDEPL
ncbi:hypothetical protein Emed_004353 [Eimeria media]